MLKARETGKNERNLAREVAVGNFPTGAHGQDEVSLRLTMVIFVVSNNHDKFRKLIGLFRKRP